MRFEYGRPSGRTCGVCGDHCQSQADGCLRVPECFTVRAGLWSHTCLVTAPDSTCSIHSAIPLLRCAALPIPLCFAALPCQRCSALSTLLLLTVRCQISCPTLVRQRSWRLFQPSCPGSARWMTLVSSSETVATSGTKAACSAMLDFDWYVTPVSRFGQREVHVPRNPPRGTVRLRNWPRYVEI